MGNHKIQDGSCSHISMPHLFSMRIYVLLAAILTFYSLSLGHVLTIVTQVGITNGLKETPIKATFTQHLLSNIVQSGFPGGRGCNSEGKEAAKLGKFGRQEEVKRDSPE